MESINNNIIFNTINNGIIILDENLNILAWNNWLEITTKLTSKEMVNQNICDKFDYINKTKLKRKIKSVLVTNNSAFYTIDPHEYLIDIKVNTIIDKIFESMQQNITIVPYDIEKRQVCLYIYDNTKLCETNYKLEKLNVKLKDLSNRDPLTHLYNRRYFAEISNKMLALSLRNDNNLTIIILDIDKFKSINDTYGHSVGDNVIITLARELENNIRDSDLVARFGGEEFVILLNNTDLDNSVNIAEKIRKRIEKIEIKDDDNILKFTASFGVAKYDDNLDNGKIEHTITRADNALYIAKENGRNQVIVDL